MWSHQASAPSIFLSATSKDSYFYLSERKIIPNCSNSDLSILCLIPYLASSMITLLISIYYQFYSIKKKKKKVPPFFNLASSLEHNCLSPSPCWQTYQKSSLQSLHSLTSAHCPGHSNLESWQLFSLECPLRGQQKPLPFRTDGLTIFHLRNVPKGSFFLKLSPLLVLVILLLAHSKAHHFWSSSSLIPNVT